MIYARMLQENGKYGELFALALKSYGILCIGLYRFRDTSSTLQRPSSKRYVITNPPDDFPLLPTDKVSVCVLYCCCFRFVVEISILFEIPFLHFIVARLVIVVECFIFSYHIHVKDFTFLYKFGYVLC